MATEDDVLSEALGSGSLDGETESEDPRLADAQAMIDALNDGDAEALLSALDRLMIGGDLEEMEEPN